MKWVVRMNPVTVDVSAFCNPAVNAARYIVSERPSPSATALPIHSTPTAIDTTAAVAGVLCWGVLVATPLRMAPARKHDTMPRYFNAFIRVSVSTSACARGWAWVACVVLA